MLNEYIKWSPVEDQSITYIGVLTEENDDDVKFLTKCGEMTILKSDGYFQTSDREEFDKVFVPDKVVNKKVSKEPKVGSKVERALLIFTTMTSEGKVRKDIIKALMEQLDMTSPGASTYYQNIKKKLGL
jgi:hypothetical protein